MFLSTVKKLGRTIQILSATQVSPKLKIASVQYSQSSSNMNFETLAIHTPSPFVYHVELNKPKINAICKVMWREIGECFNQLSDNPDCRAIVISGAGKLFTAGIDLNDIMDLAPVLGDIEDVGRKSKFLYGQIKRYQDSLTSLEKCVKPVIAAVHSACVGAGVDLITAADIRYCSKDAWFQVKEVQIGMAADVGTLQRLPKVIGSNSLVRELCYTGRKMESKQALECGLVSRVFDDKDSLVKGAIDLAIDIAEKSPIAVQGTKLNLIYSRDHTVQEGLDHIALYNQSMLQSEDFVNGAMGQMTKEKTVFAKL